MQQENTWGFPPDLVIHSSCSMWLWKCAEFFWSQFLKIIKHPQNPSVCVWTERNMVQSCLCQQSNVIRPSSTFRYHVWTCWPQLTVWSWNKTIKIIIPFFYLAKTMMCMWMKKFWHVKVVFTTPIWKKFCTILKLNFRLATPKQVWTTKTIFNGL